MFGTRWDSLRKKWVVTDCKLENTNCRKLTINYQNRWTWVVKGLKGFKELKVVFGFHLTQMAQKVYPANYNRWDSLRKN